jgi:ribosome-binding protein aMBF1 (putative translation factor)
MKDEQERILRYIGELYGRRRMEKQQGKVTADTGPEHDDIVKAGRRIRKIREQQKMDLEQLGRLTGLTPNYIAAIEIGEADPYMTEIYEITKALGIELSSLFDKD